MLVAGDRLERLIRWQAFVLTAEGRAEFMQLLAEHGVDGACALKGLPRGRVLAFLAEHAGLSEAVKRVLEVQTHALVGEALDVADEQREVFREDGSAYDPDVARDKLRVETRLKIAEKLNRGAYGRTVDHRHTHTVDLGDRLRRAMAREREGRVVAEQTAPALLHPVVTAVEFGEQMEEMQVALERQAERAAAREDGPPLEAL